MVNVNKLKGKMRECGKSQEDMAKALNLSTKTVNERLKCGVFKTNEIDLISSFLGLKKEESVEIFFNQKVSWKETNQHREEAQCNDFNAE